ncbi:MAG TPA: MBL fold metallo-hydrolase [Candidatus Polarisedimenticolaceae bacterium]|nr:MBL fold metallo-hydrolase [Candidatus Polarisedimenticolaceae bacterium]
MVRVVPLGSGSSGNATLIAFGERTVLVDAGLSARDLALRLAAAGQAAERLDAILLSHEHHDHARGLFRFATRHRVPVFTTPEVLDALNLAPHHLPAWHAFTPGSAFETAGIEVTPFSVPHDAVNPVGFVLRAEGIRVGIVTDIGHMTTLVQQRLRGCHVLLVEANHDDAMLLKGSYPWALKQRIGGRLGHLSNDEAATLVAAVADDETQAVVLAHLSDKNNTAALARAAVANALDRAGRRRVAMRVALRSAPTPAVEV